MCSDSKYLYVCVCVFVSVNLHLCIDLCVCVCIFTCFCVFSDLHLLQTSKLKQIKLDQSQSEFQNFMIFFLCFAVFYFPKTFEMLKNCL